MARLQQLHGNLLAGEVGYTAHSGRKMFVE